MKKTNLEECVHWTRMPPLSAKINKRITLESEKKIAINFKLELCIVVKNIVK